MRMADSYGVPRTEFLTQYQGNELDPNWMRRVGRLAGHGWKDFIKNERDKIKAVAHGRADAGGGNRS